MATPRRGLVAANTSSKRRAAMARGKKAKRDFCEIVFTWPELIQNVTWLNFSPHRVAFTNYNHA